MVTATHANGVLRALIASDSYYFSAFSRTGGTLTVSITLKAMKGRSVGLRASPNLFQRFAEGGPGPIPVEIPDGSLLRTLRLYGRWLVLQGFEETPDGRIFSEALERQIPPGLKNRVSEPLTERAGYVTFDFPESATLRAAWLAKLKQENEPYLAAAKEALASVRRARQKNRS